MKTCCFIGHGRIWNNADAAPARAAICLPPRPV